MFLNLYIKRDFKHSANSIIIYLNDCKGQPKRELWLLQEYDNPTYDVNQEAKVLNSYNNWLIKEYETNIYDGFNEEYQSVLKLTDSH